MLSTVKTDTNQEERAAAILDVDGALHPSDIPLGIGFSQYLLEETARRTVGYHPETEIDPDYFASDKWDDVRQDIEAYRADEGGEHEVFRPRSLQSMTEDWYEMTAGEQDYASGAMAITSTWVQGVAGMQRDDVEARADEYIDQITEDIPRAVNNILGTLEGPNGSHNVFLVSLNPQEVLEPYAEVIFGGPYGRERAYGTVVATDGTGRYVDTAEPERDMVTGEGKGDAIREIAAHPGTVFDQHSLAVGDTYADLPLFRNAHHAALVNARNGLNEHVLQEKLINGDEEAQVFNVKGVDDIVRRLTGESAPDPQIVEVDEIQEFWDALRNDEALGEALGLR